MAPTAPWILGIASSHNGAACLIHGDEIVVAIQEERLLRRKRARHPGGRDSLAIRYCLEAAGITPRDLDLIVLAAASASGVKAEDVTLNPTLRPSHHGTPTLAVSHHLAHAIGAFATSGHDSAAVLVVDGFGSPWTDLPARERKVVNPQQALEGVSHTRGPLRETISLYMADGTGLIPVEKQVGAIDLRPKLGMPRFWSLGSMYESVGAQIFGSGLDGAGKVMGLAPFGEVTVPARDFYTLTDGRLRCHDIVPDRYLDDEHWPLRRIEYQNLAASVQEALQDAIYVLALRLRRLTGASRLCYAGGVALNSVANQLIIENAGFDDVFIMPAAEDSGTALGAAYYGLSQLTGKTAHRRLVHDAVGRNYESDEVGRAIEGCPGVHTIAVGDILDRVVDLLVDGRIVGWFNGRSELGPRALGQRSIICDPRRSEMKDVLNSTVKFREAFRPFAPVIAAEQLRTYFTGPPPDESPFMLRVMPFREEVRHLVPAVVHVDGTGRVQTVTRTANGKFYELVVRFYERTGCPVLLNTSFNVAGEPIVETAEDALGCLLFSGLHACALEDWLVVKNDDYRSPLDLTFALNIERAAFDYHVNCGWRQNGLILDGRISFFQSMHLDRAADLEKGIANYEGHIIRIVTRTRWGPVLHLASAELFPVLTYIDGRRNGWTILEMLSREYGAALDERGLSRMLATLKRASIISW